MLFTINPFRYRGYFYDVETGLYYLQSRYYVPQWGRFLNADGYVSTGQGLLGYNMFAYCGNNPVNRIDPTGEFWITSLIVAGIITICALPLSGCSSSLDLSPLPYQTADEAARAFSEEVYSSSLYIRHEYSTEIYSKTINGKTTYGYNTPRSGKPHSATVNKPSPTGTVVVAYTHHIPILMFFLTQI